MKPNVDRGEAHHRHLCSGTRKNPENSGIGTCAFKPPKNQFDLQRQEEITRSVGELCGQLKKVTSSFIKTLPDEQNLKFLQREQ